MLKDERCGYLEVSGNCVHLLIRLSDIMTDNHAQHNSVDGYIRYDPRVRASALHFELNRFGNLFPNLYFLFFLNTGLKDVHCSAYLEVSA